jgi:hypothetical protein
MNQALYAHMNNKRKRKKKIESLAPALQAQNPEFKPHSPPQHTHSGVFQFPYQKMESSQSMNVV